MTDDIRNLLGGYATGTLSEEERKVLFEAALKDDALFAALADEQALKELLDDGGIRAQVLRATEESRFTLSGALREWFDRPKSKALVATGLVLLTIIGYQQIRQARNQSREAPTTVATQRYEPTGDPPSHTIIQRSPNPAPPATSNSPTTARRPRPDENLAIMAPKKETAQSNGNSEPAPTGAPAAPPPPPSATFTQAEEAKHAAAEGAVSATAPSMVATNSLRSQDQPVAAPQTAAPSARAARSGPPAGAFQRAAGTSVTPLRYELLRRMEDGSFQAVPGDYVFTPGDIVRLRVNTTRSGVVRISSSASNQILSGAVTPNTWMEIPSFGGYSITTTTDKLVVALTPSDGIVSGVQDATQARAKQTEPTSVYLEIPIRRKNP